MEVNFVNLYRGQPPFFEIFKTLHEFGFIFYDLHNVVYSPKGQIKWCDAIFISDKLKDKIKLV